MKLIRDFILDEEGAAIAEYAMLLGFIMVPVTATVTALGQRINSTISRATSILPT